MAWAGTFTYVDNTVYNAANLNAYWRDNIRFLRGIGETETARDLPLYTPGLRVDTDTMEFKRTYTASPVIYRIVGEKTNTPTTLAVNHSIDLLIQLRDGDEGDYETVGLFRALRTGVATGKLLFYQYRDGIRGTFPAFGVDPTGFFVGKTSAAYAMDISSASIMRANVYYKNGLAIGQWVRDANGNMTFTGEAEVAGQFILEGNGAEIRPPIITESQTLVANLNVGKLRGVSWQSNVLQDATSKSIISTNGFWHINDTISWYDVDAQVLNSVVATESGRYLVIASASLELSRDVGGIGASITIGPSDPAEDGGTYQVISNMASSQTAGDVNVQTHWILDYSAGDNIECYVMVRSLVPLNLQTVKGQMVALLLSPRAQAYPSSVTATSTINAVTATIT